MKSIFSASTEKRCEICIFCAFDPTADKLLCEKKGLVDRKSKCFRFRYDPFKRMPSTTPKITTHSPEEFSLDVDDSNE